MKKVKLPPCRRLTTAMPNRRRLCVLMHDSKRITTNLPERAHDLLSPHKHTPSRKTRRPMLLLQSNRIPEILKRPILMPSSNQKPTQLFPVKLVSYYLPKPQMSLREYTQLCFILSTKRPKTMSQLPAETP